VAEPAPLIGHQRTWYLEASQTTRRSRQTVLAVQAGNTFTPLPKGVQSFLGETPTW